MNMIYEDLSLVKTDDFPIRNMGVHSGKVSSMYWLTREDSASLIKGRGYKIPETNLLGVRIVSDRISAFDTNWEGEEGLYGVPGKGATTNAVSNYWFDLLKMQGIADNHVLETPHPMVWIVNRAEPIMFEAIAREYITGSMWRAYEKGEREFCGIELPNGLKQNQKLEEILFTPTSKSKKFDFPITKERLLEHYWTYGFNSHVHVEDAERILVESFKLISEKLEEWGHIFVDTKFEFGYVKTLEKDHEMIIIDEIANMDSSRIWDLEMYKKGKIVERSKEILRRHLISTFGKSFLTEEENYERKTRKAKEYKIPTSVMLKISDEYKEMARLITGREIYPPNDSRNEIIAVMSALGLVA